MTSLQTNVSTASRTGNRIFSIDAFRALTMLTMIFVNDFWTLTGIPKWLEHASAKEDFLGFSDVVFPCFLFIVGMSIPFAIRQRLDKGDTYPAIIWHIVIRSVALLIMGVFTVNVPSLNAEATGLSTQWFQILMVLAFFLIWNQYPKRSDWLRMAFIALQVLGIGLLVYLALRFRGGNSGELVGMKTQWWGILGLIGWTYLTCALVYLFVHKSPALLFAAWFLFTLCCIAGHAGWLKAIWPDGPGDWILGNGAFSSFTFSGILATYLLTYFSGKNQREHLLLRFASIGILFLMAGVFARHFFIISKIQATPTWVFLCCGIAFVTYAVIYLFVDLQANTHTFDLIKPAGTSTLTCYVIPYVYYSIADLSGISVPEFLKTGGVGLVKSLLFALLVIGITAVLGKLRIKLKL
ncbi:lpg1661 family Dot/Icm T4SS effector [Spirosoma daeguense]